LKVKPVPLQYGGLHAQVAAFARAAGPDDADVAKRDFVYKKIAAAVKELYPEANVEVFGSGATGLALKDADIDLVVLGVGPSAYGD
jgi:DNA polymerase sigma